MLSVAVHFACVLFMTAQIARQDDPFLGTWVLNLSESIHRETSTPNQSFVRTHESVGDAVRITRDVVDAAGRRTRSEWLLRFDGKHYPSTAGTDSKATMALSRIDRQTVQIEVRFETGDVLTQTISISEDGKTLTLREKGRNGRGVESNSVSVFDRQ